MEIRRLRDVAFEGCAYKDGTTFIKGSIKLPEIPVPIFLQGDYAQCMGLAREFARRPDGMIMAEIDIEKRYLAEGLAWIPTAIMQIQTMHFATNDEAYVDKAIITGVNAMPQLLKPRSLGEFT